jgi:hypothetical protein
MAVFCHLVGASSSGKQLEFAEFKEFLFDLLHEELVALPAAIFVGDACENPEGYYWSTDAAYTSILPNSPGSMIELLEEYGEISSVETLWYDGDDEATLKEALARVPFGKKDICVCFDLVLEDGERGSSRYGEGVAIYALRRPFPVHYEALKSSFRYDLSQFVVCYTSLGRNILSMKPLLKRVLERYFGEALLLEESLDR